MYAARAENLFHLFRSAAPTLLGVMGVLLLASPIRLAQGYVPTPLIPLVVVYFWSIYSPASLPAFGVFLIGIFHDLMTGGPLGLWSTIYLFTYYIVVSQRTYFQGRDQQVVWLGFITVSAIASLILWGVMSLLSGARLPIGGLVLQMLVTTATYPVIAVFFAQFHRRILVEG